MLSWLCLHFYRGRWRAVGNRVFISFAFETRFEHCGVVSLHPQPVGEGEGISVGGVNISCSSLFNSFVETIPVGMVAEGEAHIRRLPAFDPADRHPSGGHASAIGK